MTNVERIQAAMEEKGVRPALTPLSPLRLTIFPSHQWRGKTVYVKAVLGPVRGESPSSDLTNEHPSSEG